MKRHIPYGLVLIGIVACWAIFLIRLDKWDLEFVGVVLVFSAFIGWGTTATFSPTCALGDTIAEAWILLIDLQPLP